jgi:predicted nuclease of predicted toxin-antitoxin system
MRLTVRRAVEAVSIHPAREDFFRNYPELAIARARRRAPGARVRRCESRGQRGENARRLMEIAGLRLLLDQGPPRDAAWPLRAVGVSCTHVGEAGMSAAADTEILECARLGNSVVVTLDADFHAILAVRNASKPSVVRVRNEVEREPQSQSCCTGSSSSTQWNSRQDA